MVESVSIQTGPALKFLDKKVVFAGTETIPEDYYAF